MARNAEDVTPQDPQLADNPLYLARRERAEQDKPPSRSGAVGAVAAARAPGAETRTEMIDQLLAEDGDLVAGSFGTVYYRPVTVCGVDLKLEPIQPSIGTVVHGIDLATNLTSDEMVTFLRRLWLKRHVVVFRNQNHLTREQMRDFATCFGEIGAPFGEREHIPNSPHDLNQQIKAPEVPEMLILPSDEAVPNAAASWHCDATWQSRPPMASVLMCREAPPVGGDTCFCNCHAMWEGLPHTTRERVRHLTAVHMGSVGHQMDGVTPVSVHPVARTHPETGQTSLYVQQGFVKHFAPEHEVPEDEAHQLLHQMKMQEGRPEYTCRVKWEPGSIAMWDNRSVLHTASGDFWPHRRLMERLTILDRDESRRAPYYDEKAELRF